MQKLKKQINDKNFSNIYLFYGEEKYFINKYVGEIVSATGLKDDLMNYEVFKENATVSQIIDASATLPMFSENRVVIVRDSGIFTKDRKDKDELVESIGEVAPTTILIFIETKVDKKLKSYKAVAKIADIYEMNFLKENELVQYVDDEVKKYGLEISKSNIHYFLQNISNDMSKILIEINKLSNFVGEGDITKEHIDDVCTKTLDFKVFKLMEFVGKKNIDEALTMYDWLIESKESPILILSLIYKHIKMLLQVKYMLSKNETQSTIASRLSIHSFVAKQYIEQCKNFKTRELYEYLQLCLENDINIKTGVISDKIAVWNLIVRFAT